MTEPMTIVAVGKTEAGNAEVQPARDSRFKATNCRWGGSNTCHPILRFAKIIQSFVMPEKTYKKSPAEGGSILAEGKESLLTKKWICPIYAEPLHTQDGKKIIIVALYGRPRVVALLNRANLN